MGLRPDAALAAYCLSDMSVMSAVQLRYDLSSVPSSPC